MLLHTGGSKFKVQPSSSGHPAVKQMGRISSQVTLALDTMVGCSPSLLPSQGVLMSVLPYRDGSTYTEAAIMYFGPGTTVHHHN